MRIETDSPFDLRQLGDEIAAAVGQETVALSGRQPGQPDGEGGTLPGVIVAPDDLDETAVRDAIVAHEPAPAVDAAAELADAITAATTVEELKAALLGQSSAAQVAARPS